MRNPSRRRAAQTGAIQEGTAEPGKALIYPDTSSMHISGGCSFSPYRAPNPPPRPLLASSNAVFTRITGPTHLSGPTHIGGAMHGTPFGGATEDTARGHAQPKDTVVASAAEASGGQAERSKRVPGAGNVLLTTPRQAIFG